MDVNGARGCGWKVIGAVKKADTVDGNKETIVNSLRDAIMQL